MNRFKQSQDPWFQRRPMLGPMRLFTNNWNPYYGVRPRPSLDRVAVYTTRASERSIYRVRANRSAP